jgi:ABC-2 type transport system ATP-binding protein
VLALDRLDLTIGRGELFGLLGSNGAGKTTTIKILTTLLPPSTGTAVVAGFDVVRDAREVRRRIGYVPQLVSADAMLTARENLVLSAKLHGVPRADREQRIAEALALMDLTAVAGALVRSYSGGMIRRLEIAQAMLHRPEVLFLDEPTVGLDPVARRVVWDRLRELRAQFGTSILLTTHDMEEADVLCSRIAILHRGQLVAQGAPSELKAAAGSDATLEDVFIRATGAAVDTGGAYRDVARTRRTAQRLG